MGAKLAAKRKADGSDGHKAGRRTKKPRRQVEYDSDQSGASGDEDGGTTRSVGKSNGGVALTKLQDTKPSARHAKHKAASLRQDSAEPLDEEDHASILDDDESDVVSNLSSDTETSTSRKRRKRDDPDAFATSLSKIINSKLSTAKRADPVLARSKVALTASKELVDARLEAKARHKLREERKAHLDRARVKDVLGVDKTNGEVDGSSITVAETIELERRLKKTAQRGVVKLFNAVRAAQVKGEQAAKEAKKTGVVSARDREAKVNEMSKKGFLDLIASGGGGGGGGRKGGQTPVIQEA